MFSAMNAIPTPVQALLDLFSTSLADVRFADVNADTLARFAGEVQAAAEVVTSAQAALDAAREALQEKQDALLTHAQRALAYARVYAEGDDALSVQLDAVSLPRPQRRSRGDDALILSAEPQPSPRPRGRPRKTAIAEPALEPIFSPAE
jgi:hypothetical protein